VTSIKWLCRISRYSRNEKALIRIFSLPTAIEAASFPPRSLSPNEPAVMTTPRVGMHSLPTELKEQIVRCCAEQDALLASALAAVRRDKNAGTKTERTRLRTVRRAATEYRSLAALAAVSREWNELAAPALFQVR
jgi:hypothetical protein